MYKISIIVPTFNVEDTLQNAFNSILSQSIGFENLEVIFVDDKSTDNSPNILKNLSNKYSNVKTIYLDENSGFAGKPRNIGIENATADYLMFLDPDDIFLKNACELLYKNITENKLNMVSANYNINRDSKIVRNNWNILKLKDKQSTQVKSIDENFKLLLPTPSVWSKIFKKEFILNENIKFLEGVPAQDLVFVSEALLKAEGIKFINTPIVEYIPRQSGDNKSVTSKRTKSVLTGFIKSYNELYNLIKNYNKEYCWIGFRNLFFWIKQFVLSDLPITDKIDLLYISNPLFEEFIKSDKLKRPQFLDEFLELIDKKDFLNASLLSEKLSIYYRQNNEIIDIIKTKNIISLFYGMDLNIGGLAKAVFNRDNVINNHGYTVKLLNIDELKNFEYIISYFKNNGFLNKSIEFINIFEYYSKKNTVNEFISRHTFLDGIPMGFSIYEEHIIEKKESADKSIIINYYDKNVEIEEDIYNIEISQSDLVKSETYMNNYLRLIKTYINGKLYCEKFFTKDDYNYLTIKYENYDKFVTLNNQKNKIDLKFSSLFEFYDYFYNEFLIDFIDNKPFLINECSGPVPDFDNVDSKLAYKISNIHTNPYEGNHCFGSSLRNVAALKNVDKLDSLVVLTEGLKKDFIKEFNTEKIDVVPNFPNSFEKPSNKDISKDYNKISIFSRLSSEKNLSDAIKAFRIVVDERKDSYLNIYGRALKPYEINEEKKLHALVKELNLEENVLFKGHVDNVDEEMANSLATMLVSDIEGMPMVILESMRNATPVICYNFNYGPSDFIIDGITGRLIEQYDVKELANAILDAYNNPSKTIEMGVNAQDKILNEMNEEKLFLRWENIFKDTYIKSEKQKLNNFNKVSNHPNPKEYEEFERQKIKFYKEIDKLSREKRLLKKQINAKKTSKLKRLLKKF